MNEKNELFLSICIPTYNRAQLLKRCVNSILASNNEKIEIIISDNASTDNTSEILASFQDERIKYHRNETNIGGPRNSIEVLKLAKGKWIFILTDDDYLLPGALEKIIKILKSKDEIGVFLSGLKVVDCDENFLFYYNFYERESQNDHKYNPRHRPAKFSSGLEALKNLLWASHVLSRITIQRQYLTLDSVEKHFDSMYPQMWIVGKIILTHPGYYCNEYFVAHTSGNITYWDYPQDYMIGSRIKLIKDLLPGEAWKKERKVLINQYNQDIANSIIPITWEKPIGLFLSHQISILRNREVFFSYYYWKGITIVLIKPIISKMMGICRKTKVLLAHPASSNEICLRFRSKFCKRK